ncbi:MAG: hypothetical protein RRY10_02790, partial [Christensenellaceae bacterium]
SLNELINSDDMQYAYAFTIFVYSINGAFYSLNESMAMLESEGLPSDSLDPILGLSNIPDVGNVVSYEMTFYLSNKDGEFSIQTPIAFLNIRKAVCAE